MQRWPSPGGSPSVASNRVRRYPLGFEGAREHPSSGPARQRATVAATSPTGSRARVFPEMHHAAAAGGNLDFPGDLNLAVFCRHDNAPAKTREIAAWDPE
jgi:hypothetical protein